MTGPVVVANRFVPLKTPRSRRKSAATSTAGRSFGVPGFFRRRNSKKAAAAEAGESRPSAGNAPGGDDAPRHPPHFRSSSRPRHCPVDTDNYVDKEERGVDTDEYVDEEEGETKATNGCPKLAEAASGARDSNAEAPSPAGPTISTRLRLPDGRAGAVAPAQVINFPAASATVSTLTAGWPEASRKRYADGCAAGIGPHGRVGPERPPNGGREAFDAARARYHARQSDPRAVARFLPVERGRPERAQEKDNDARADRSRSLPFGAGPSPIGGDARTARAADRSGSLFPYDEGFDDASLELKSAKPKEMPDEMLDKTTTSPHAFKLISTPPEGRRARPLARSPRDGRDDDAADAFDSTAAEGAGCSLPPGVDEEVLGSCSDLRSAFRQVLHAFFVSEEDVDAVAGRVWGDKAVARDTYRQ